MRRVVGMAVPALICLCVVALLASSFGTSPAEGRPQYNKAWDAAYPDLKAAHGTVKCDLCHVPKEKKDKRNSYGAAIGKALGKENVKDEAEINKAFETAEKSESAIKGKTFGDLIKGGKLPNSDK